MHFSVTTPDKSTDTIFPSSSLESYSGDYSDRTPEPVQEHYCELSDIGDECFPPDAKKMKKEERRQPLRVIDNIPEANSEQRVEYPRKV